MSIVIGNKTQWSLDIKEHYWTDNTEKEVEFIINALELCGKERVLDLACGFGRHSLLLARKGFDVTGVDITEAYISDARQTAHELGIKVNFIVSNIIELDYCNEFDVVLNLADGAIGYFKEESSNLKVFDIISKSLKSGGKSVMDIFNVAHAQKSFPKKSWHIGEHSLGITQYAWNEELKRIQYAEKNLPYNNVLNKPFIHMRLASSIRAYNELELKEIIEKRDMKITSTYSNYTFSQPTTDCERIIIISNKV